MALKAVLLFAVAVIGLRLGERRTLTQLGASDFAVAVAIGSIIGRTATASSWTGSPRPGTTAPPARRRGARASVYSEN